MLGATSERVVGLLLLLSGTLAAQSAFGISTSLSYSNSLFKYTYTVTDTGSAPIWLVSMRLNTTTLPSSIGTPQGWQSQVAVDEGATSVVWYTQGTGIQPNQTLSGFVFFSPLGPKGGVSFSVATDGTGDANQQDVPSLCAGDVNNDGVVDIADLNAVKASFGKRLGDPLYNTDADIDRNGVVDIFDLSFVSKNIGCRVQ